VYLRAGLPPLERSPDWTREDVDIARPKQLEALCL
jgi:hypothetical protein